MALQNVPSPVVAKVLVEHAEDDGGHDEGEGVVRGEVPPARLEGTLERVQQRREIRIPALVLWRRLKEREGEPVGDGEAGRLVLRGEEGPGSEGGGEVLGHVPHHRVTAVGHHEEVAVEPRETSVKCGYKVWVNCP